MRVPLRFAVLVTTLALAGCFSFGGHISSSHAYHQSLQRNFVTSGSASVHLANVAGRITVQAWDKPGIRIDALKYGGSQRDLADTSVVIERFGNTIRVHTKYPKNDGIFGLFEYSELHHGASVDYTLHVPARTTLEIANVSGWVRVDGIAGPVHVADVSGSIEANGVGGDLHLATTAGSVDVSMQHLAGSTSVDIATVSGGVDLTIPKNSSASLDAKTVAGTISSAFPLRTKKGTVGSSASGTVGRGSAHVSLATVAGSISIDAK